MKFIDAVKAHSMEGNSRPHMISKALSHHLRGLTIYPEAIAALMEIGFTQAQASHTLDWAQQQVDCESREELESSFNGLKTIVFPS
jgi:hypothetical protein